MKSTSKFLSVRMARGRFTIGCALLFAACAGAPVKLDGPKGPPPPLLVEPEEDAVSTVARPTLRWRLPRGEDGAHVTLCAKLWCPVPLREVDVSGESWTPDVDLPSGTIFVRLRGGVGGRFGLDESQHKVAVEVKVAVEGKLVDVIAPREQEPFATEMAAVADRALRFYSSFLGADLPDIHLRVYCYLSAAGLADASVRYARGRLKGHAGFSGAWGSHVRLVPGNGTVDMKNTVLHELLHAFQNQSVLLHRDHPIWYREGMADLLSNRALVEGEKVAAPLPRIEQARAALRKLVAEKKFLPLARLFAAGEEVRRADDPSVEKALYAESLLLLDYLDSPSVPERRARFRAFARDVAGMRGFFVATRIHSRLEKDFGSAAELERALLASIADKPADDPELH